MKIDALCLETSSESSDSDSDPDESTPVNDFSKEVCGIAIEEMSDEEYCLVFDKNSATEANKAIWHFDSGCGKHMTGDQANLINYKPCNNGPTI